MNQWSFDITAAPRDRHLWLASECKKVIKSYWDEKRGQWSGFATNGKAPVAWQHFVVPEYPFRAKASDDNGATGQSEKVTADRVTGDASRPSRGGDSPAFILDDCGSGQ
ncbi:hypothetical protein [Rhizobium sp. BK251]|uniref:hypothetical protein n=1 Tax=Rhizobium sp. BK251 TaxID=2512125 RepID=UPI0010517E7E|nr:hypothetical protein [Rhizobium sp. BK251]TCL70616.1 hypothetical protein EV286_107493 [Rhizobium sp. BK251]